MKDQISQLKRKPCVQRKQAPVPRNSHLLTAARYNPNQATRLKHDRRTRGNRHRCQLAKGVGGRNGWIFLACVLAALMASPAIVARVLSILLPGVVLALAYEAWRWRKGRRGRQLLQVIYPRRHASFAAYYMGQPVKLDFLWAAICIWARGTSYFAHSGAACTRPRRFCVSLRRPLRRGRGYGPKWTTCRLSGIWLRCVPASILRSMTPGAPFANIASALLMSSTPVLLNSRNT